MVNFWSPLPMVIVCVFPPFPFPPLPLLLLLLSSQTLDPPLVLPEPPFVVSQAVLLELELSIHTLLEVELPICQTLSLADPELELGVGVGQTMLLEEDPVLELALPLGQIFKVLVPIPASQIDPLLLPPLESHTLLEEAIVSQGLGEGVGVGIWAGAGATGLGFHGSGAGA